MAHNQEQTPETISASELITNLFAKIFGDAEKFDAEVVMLTKNHLWADPTHSKAANNLADVLIELAKQRAAAGIK